MCCVVQFHWQIPDSLLSKLVHYGRKPFTIHNVHIKKQNSMV